MFWRQEQLADIVRNARRFRRLTLSVKSDRLDLSLRSSDSAQGFCAFQVCILFVYPVPVTRCTAVCFWFFHNQGLDGICLRTGKILCSEPDLDFCTKRLHIHKINLSIVSKKQISSACPIFKKNLEHEFNLRLWALLANSLIIYAGFLGTFIVGKL